jgi:hypothetical protein
MVRAGPLSDPAIVKQLRPFIVTSWHGAGEAEMETGVKDIFKNSAVAKDPKRLNIFVFMLDYQGKLVHSFHGLPSGGRGGDGRSDYDKEIAKGLARLKLPSEQTPSKEVPGALPDLKASGAGTPAGVRLFVRLNDEKDPVRSRTPVVEVVPMKAEEWKALAYPNTTQEIEARVLKNWLVQLYPAGIRTADQTKPFTKIAGTLKLEPAGADKDRRYALLRGAFRLEKGADESAGEGTIQAVLTYRAAAPEVQSLRGVIEGAYLYKTRATQRMPLIAVIESRPE